MDTELARLADSKYVLITTFRKTGAGVPTPVWAARLGDELVLWSRTTAGKVKRVRRDGRVELAECDFRGNPRGPAIQGAARILGDDESERARRAIAGKYGVLGRITMLGSKLRRGRTGTVGIAVRTGPPSTEG